MSCASGILPVPAGQMALAVHQVLISTNWCLGDRGDKSPVAKLPAKELKWFPLVQSIKGK